jgi:NAD(P)-dependent dehydrogenase (short-subunit alcohol dehydrogenase family)
MRKGWVQPYGERVKPVIPEVRDEAAAKAAVQLAVDAFGRLDVLVWSTTPVMGSLRPSSK